MSMMTRAKVVGAVTAAFIGGLGIATAFELPQSGFAQSTPSTRAANGPRGDDDGPPGFADVAERVTPAVVSIRVETDARTRAQAQGPRRNVPPEMEEFLRQFQGPQGPRLMEGSGTGFLVTSSGYILTNNHVVGDADRIKVVLTDHREFNAKLIGRDPTTDVAVIKIEGTGFPTVTLGDDHSARIGSWVLAIGNPLGLDFTVTAGIISAKGRGVPAPARQNTNASRYAISDFIQTDAAINPGNSGGPLINARGEVIGINSMIASETGYYSGYGFAIPISLAKTVSDDLIASGRVRRAVLGVSIKDVTPEEAKAAQLATIAGVTLGDFTSDGNAQSPAKSAGLEPGDVIVAVEGQPVDRVGTLQRIVRSKKPGDVVSVDIVRFGDRKNFRVRLAEAPTESAVLADAGSNRKADGAESTGVSAVPLGITVEAITEASARATALPAGVRGVRVSEVSVSGRARGKLFTGDVITEVVYPRPRRAIRTTADLQAAIKDLKSGDVITFSVLNPDGQSNRVETIQIGGN